MTLTLHSVILDFFLNNEVAWIAEEKSRVFYGRTPPLRTGVSPSNTSPKSMGVLP
jgi:hypothetical protein